MLPADRATETRPAPPVRRAARDRQAKLLALLDFSAGATGPTALDETLSVLLLSLMGEFAAPGAAILLQEPPGSLVFRAAKGAHARTLLDRTVPLPERIKDAETTVDIALDLAEGGAEGALRATALAAGLEVLLPVRNRGRLLGFLGLTCRASGCGYSPEELELVRLVANIAGTVVANHLLYGELVGANRELRRKVFELHTVFDVSRELNACLDAQSILRIVAQTAMAHTLVSQSAVLLAAGDRLRLSLSRGLPAGAEAAVPAAGFAIPLGADEPGPDLGAWLRATGLATMVPLRVGEETRGYLALAERKDGRPVAREDVEFLSTLGHQAVTALDNLKLHTDRAVRERLVRELAIARDIQAGLFPKSLPEVAGFGIAARSEPCFEVGGDYYDAVRTPQGVFLALGDVAGKSIPAALLMSVLQATVRTLARRPDEAPATMLVALNERLFASTQPGKFASFFVGLLDPATGRLRYGNAGHNPPLLRRAGGAIERLTVGGPVLGIFDDACYEEAAVTLERGDLLFLYTDGVTEAMDHADVEFGEERLADLLHANCRASACDVLDRVIASVRDHAKGLDPMDDLTAMALTRLGDETGVAA